MTINGQTLFLDGTVMDIPQQISLLCSFSFVMEQAEMSKRLSLGVSWGSQSILGNPQSIPGNTQNTPGNPQSTPGNPLSSEESLEHSRQ